MGRTLLYACILFLAVFVLAAAFLLRTGGGSSSSAVPVPVSVHDLSVAPQAYTGERVETSGVLRFLHEPDDHFVVTEEGLGIVIRGYDQGALRTLAGEAVAVAGRFGFDEDNGAYIDAESVTAE